MKLIILSIVLCSIGVLCEDNVKTYSTEINISIGEILRKITNGILNSKNANPNGFYEVGDDGNIHFILHKDSTHSSTSPVPSFSVETSTIPQPDLSDDEQFEDSDDSDDQDGLWEKIPSEPEMDDDLSQFGQFPLVDSNDINTEEKPIKIIRSRSRRDVKVDVGGQGGGNGGVDVAVNKPGNNVNVNVGGLESFLNQFGVYFKKPQGAGGSGSYGSGSASYGGGNLVDVNVNKPGHQSNVDVSVGGSEHGGKPSGGVFVNSNKQGYGGNSQTAVNVDWASFIPFVNVGVNKENGESVVKVGGNSDGRPGGSLVDVKVKSSGKKHHIEHENEPPHHKDVNVDLKAPFVDVNVESDDKKEHRPHKPHKKHRPHPPHDHEDKDVHVNVGGQGGNAWWPFVNVNVDSPKTKQEPGRPKKCININVPFVNVLVNRNCEPSPPGPAPEGSPHP